MEELKRYESLLGSWTGDRLLGEGSFGKVYKLKKTDFGKDYYSALKIITIPQSKSEISNLKSEGMDEKSIKAHFEQFAQDVVSEFDLMSKLRGNSNIVSYEDHMIMPHDDGFGYDILIRMELLTSLVSLLEEKNVSKKDIIKLGIDICKALELCQKYNIIHRDIKPDNIFVSEHGEFKLGDFGIARTVEKTVGEMSKKGTYTYMAPEVYKGEKYGSGVDLYSLGIVMYRLLNGNRTPFLPAHPAPISHNDRDNALVLRMKGEKIPPPLDNDGRLAEIVMKAIEYNEKDRFISPAQMRQELESIQYTESEGQIIYPKGDGVAIHSNEYTDGKEQNQSVAAEEKTEYIGDKTVFDADATVAEPLALVMQKKETAGTAKKTNMKYIFTAAAIVCVLGIGVLALILTGVIGGSNGDNGEAESVDVVLEDLTTTESTSADLSDENETSAATTTPPTEPKTDPPTEPLTEPPTPPPTEPPTPAPTESIAPPPTEPPTEQPETTPLPPTTQPLTQTPTQTIHYDNGDIYAGEMKNGRYDGYGMYTWGDGELHGQKYVGEWKNDKRNGQGTFTYADGDTYEGTFKNNLLDGYGTYTWTNGNKYVGEWKNDKRNGQGTFTTAGGDIYEGEFKNNLFDGYGTYTWGNGEWHGQKYAGQWKNDKRNGQGMFTYINGDIYEGGFKNDLLDGYGTFTWSHGEKYVGQFKNDAPNGQGTYTWADGGKYVGEFKNWKRDGKGTMIYADGRKEEGRWKDGEFIG